jgi:uncharacterized membrane protein
MAGSDRRPGWRFIEFLKSTLLGGALFLLPLALILFLLGHVYVMAKDVLAPLADTMTPDRERRIVLLGLMALGALILTAFLAGLLARTRTGKRAMHVIETSVMNKIPQYRSMKFMGENMARLESDSELKPVLARAGNGWQLGYGGAKLPGGWFTVFLPEAPNPLSGTVLYLPPQDVRQLDMPLAQAMALVSAMGVGSDQVITLSDLT